MVYIGLVLSARNVRQAPVPLMPDKRYSTSANGASKPASRSCRIVAAKPGFSWVDFKIEYSILGAPIDIEFMALCTNP